MGSVRLESLKLEGFKSFPDEVQLNFPGAVSAILGPNGSGKSNIVDAMLWVLGEQSPSILRLKNMGDVVFSGSTGRRPAGSAEVEVVLRSGDGRWADHGGRIAIKRKVLRSGPSEYRMNGKAVRLKDVVDELASVGLGTRAYSIIEQGRIGQVLSARPTDRRALLEEAAGLTRYKARKHEAELKLVRTRQNLLRINDVLDEVERSLRQLKRQARQAEKFQNMQEELAEKLERVFRMEAGELSVLKEKITRKRAQTLNEVAAAASALGGAEADLVSAQKEREETRERLEETRAEISRLDASSEGLEAFLNRSEDLLENLGDSISHAEADEADVREQLRKLSDTGGEINRELEESLKVLEKAAAATGEAREGSAEIRKRFEAKETETSRLRKDLLRSISSLTTSRNRLTELEREQDRVSYSSTQLEAEKSRLAERQKEIETRHQKALAESSEACRLAGALDEQRSELRTRRNSLRTLAQVLKEKTEKFSDEAWENRHRLTGVERELSRFNAEIEKISKLLPESVFLGRLADYLNPSPEWVEILDRVWSDRLELPVLDGTLVDGETLELLDSLEDHLELLLTDAGPEGEQWSTLEGLERLKEKAGLGEESPGWLIRAMPPAYYCEEPEEARRVAAGRPDIRVVDSMKRVWSGPLADLAPEASKLRGSLALKQERTQLLRKIGELEGRAEDSGGEYKGTMEELAGIEDSLVRLDRRCLEAEQERARTLAVETSLKQEKERLHREDEGLQREGERQKLRLTEIAEKIAALSTEVEGAEARTASLESTVEDSTSALEMIRDELNDSLRRVDRFMAEERLAAQRKETAEREAEALRKQRIFLEGRLESLAKQRRELEEELEKTRGEIVRSRTRLVEEQARLSAARQEEKKVAEEMRSTVNRVEGMGVELRQRRATHETLREQLHQVELEQAEALSRWQRLEDACMSELGRALQTLPDSEEEGGNHEELRREAEAIRSKVESMGPVNLLALEELKELSERRDFLSTQRKDLREALSSLENTIAEIDATCRERFLSTFEEVNTVFGETFSYLFGGGRASLDLVDEDQPLESGVDIIAQPPGKKNQSVQLLSGGEKALTALALLISLFRIKPSPFCILDEVDAPLDDANVERLGELVRSMTTHTQFVLITHNRRTMQRSDLLYGVTMEEPGVSRIVSARLDES